MRVLAILVTAAGLCAGGAGTAQAESSVQYDYARVISATPIVRTVEISRPERECWQEEVRHYEEADPNLGGLLVGGIIGGAVGNRFGRGDGRKAATVVGTIAGAAIGQELSRGHGRHYTGTEERCQTVHRREIEERVIGYNVLYRYNGQELHTRMDRDPGERLKVRVAVTPIE